MIKVKAPISGWHEVTREQALRWAACKYAGMMCRNSIAKLHETISGATFTEKELIDEWNRIRVERMRESS